MWFCTECNWVLTLAVWRFMWSSECNWDVKSVQNVFLVYVWLCFNWFNHMLRFPTWILRPILKTGVFCLFVVLYFLLRQLSIAMANLLIIFSVSLLRANEGKTLILCCTKGLCCLEQHCYTCHEQNIVNLKTFGGKNMRCQI